MPGMNYEAPIEARPEWTRVEIPFETLAPMKAGSPAFDRRSVRWLGVSVRAGRAGRFEFEIDDVELYAARDHAEIRAVSGPTLTVPFNTSPASDLPKGPWRELATDAPDDGKQKRLPDATALAVCTDDARGLVWFRVTLAGPLPLRWLGVNLALDIDGDPSNGMAW